MTRTLYAFDSANYALAVRDYYNVAFHQPHPPGYPLYVAFARAINVVVGDANRALVLEGIAWSVLAVVCTALLGRALFGRWVGLLAAALLVFTVGFWGYGEVAYPYVALAGETAVLAWLAHGVLQGHRGRVVWFGLAWAISLGTRWDGAVFCVPLWLWALWASRWRLRLASVGLAAAVVVAFAVPMVVLTGGLDAYGQAIRSYMQVWAAQSAYVVGDFASGGDTQASYNLNFLINYLRQMLGVGLLLLLYLFGRRFGVARLAADQRSRFMALWVAPPLLVYVFAHLGEPGYVLSLAPAAAVLIALAIFDLGDDAQAAAATLGARWRMLRGARRAGMFGTRAVVIAVLTLAIVGWNVQAFVRGVGPGRLPDLRAHDATTSLQVEFLREQPAGTTLVLAHDILRQLAFYLPDTKVVLQYSEYVPDFQNARVRTELPPGTQQVVVLDATAGARELVLSEQPRVSVWVLDVAGAKAVEHGYRFAQVVS
jgi:4-amino-4-deoxy-L-arabinose transferase-like glycosyltransferase